MRLFFPTTSLNFNEIFATECLSPKYFYNKRNYGVNNFYSIELSGDEKFITLFKKVPYFKLVDSNDSEYDQYPILIEIEVENKNNEFIQLAEDIYCTFRTIYIEKGKFKLFFLSEEHKKLVIAKSKIANETKSVQKYYDDFQVVSNFEYTKFNIENLMYPAVEFDILEQELKKDNLFNFFKGFYCLYVFRRFNNDYNSFKSRYENNINRYELINNASKCEDFDSSAFNYIIKKQLTLLEELQSEYLRELDSKHDTILLKIKSVTMDSNYQIVINISNNIENEEKKVFEILVNTVMQNHKSKTGDISDKEVFNLLETLKENIKISIRNREYLNDLDLIHKRIISRDYDIDINHLKSDTLKNLFAFILKYNNINEFVNFINVKKVRNDYLAFAFYGAFYGFSGISKILTYEYLKSYTGLLEIVDTNLIEIRKHIYKDINNTNLRNTIVYEENAGYLKKETIANYVEDSIDNSLDIELYNVIKKMTEAKKIKSFLRKSQVIVNKSNSYEKIEFLPLGKSANSDVKIIYSTNGFKYVTLLKYKNNVNENEKQEFKQKLNNIGIKDNMKTNFPWYSCYIENEGKASNLNKTQKEELVKVFEKLLSYKV